MCRAHRFTETPSRNSIFPLCPAPCEICSDKSDAPTGYMRSGVSQCSSYSPERSQLTPQHLRVTRLSDASATLWSPRCRAHLSNHQSLPETADVPLTIRNSRILLPRRQWQRRGGCPAAALPQRLGLGGGGWCVCVLPTAPRLLTVAAQGWSEQDGLGRAGALQRFRITPFLLDPFKMMNPQPDPHLHVPRGNWLLFPPPPALPPPAQRMGWLPSPLASAPIRGLFSPPTPPFRLTTGPQHQLLVAQHQPFSKQQVQAGRPQAPLQ